MNKKELGWNEAFEESYREYQESGLTVGRVILEYKRMYRIITEAGECLGEVSGKFRFSSTERQDYPAVGDWVVISTRMEEGKATIHQLLPRFSKFSRKAAGLTTEEQIVATNINTVFLVNALNNDFNLRRIERYLLLTWESGANPVIVLTKSDLCDHIDERIAEVEAIAYGVPIHVVSVKENSGIESLMSYFEAGKTVALLGSSGAGKSTLTNRLVGEQKQQVEEIREGDDRGRHTTTHRELIMLPSGGMIIDTPGMRELQLWDADDSIGVSFQDIEALAEVCRFRDCHHGNEPGCAVRSAIEDGSLQKARYNNYLKLQRELAYLDRKSDKRAQQQEKEKWKKITIHSKQKKKF
ncbi:ribosome small subunit-dependent GTPase A [Bacillus sp. PS06]|uniref:ribosome small subunit-dependent GTPase A n=1 Tax=Bacillus sp. PS06 TaxID=2764176 RepID=UPI0017840996|nr:ribosome small subunit-dependent GTPase A [Bacillus sp. PS06]MBD8067456.1 ribosome small subunit-dependent GTPase A [Bacillus sp. PS06]